MHSSSKTVSMFLLILMLSTALAPSVPLALAEEAAATEAAAPTEEAVSTEEAVPTEEAVVGTAEEASTSESMTAEATTSSASASSEDTETTPIEQQAPRLYPEIDESTGALAYSYDIVTPSGRNGMKPHLALTYNSGNEAKDSIVGFGWSLNIPSIDRINRNGTDQLYTDDTYFSSLSGELVALDATTYAAKSEKGDFLTYERSGDTWVVTDKSGTVYTFGSSADERQDDSSDTSRIYKWMLSEVRDTNGNFVSYEYEKAHVQIYPSLITYTGNGSTDGIFTVEFTHETPTQSNSDSSRAFEVDTDTLIDSISIAISGTEVMHYDLAYTSSDPEQVALLESISETSISAEGVSTTQAPTSFTYQAAEQSFEVQETWAFPDTTRDDYFQIVDVNGDALPDFIEASSDVDLGTNPRPNVSYAVFINTGSTWELDETWELPSNGDEAYPASIFNFLDVNGDGLQDIFLNRTDTGTHQVFINSGAGWEEDTSWVIPTYVSETDPTEVNYYSFVHDFTYPSIDVNGDGLVDLVAMEYDKSHSDPIDETFYRVFLNTGAGWEYDETWELPHYINSSSDDIGYDLDYDDYFDFFDINGDTRLDFVVMGGGGSYSSSTEASTYCVFLNTGEGWEHDPDWDMPTYIKGGRITSFSFDANYDLFSDVNGDGLVDFMVSDSGLDPDVRTVYLNTGEGWKEGDWEVPMLDASSYLSLKSFYSRLADFTGDGLPDLMYMTTSNPGVAVNTGSGWEWNDDWNMPDGGEYDWNKYLDPRDHAVLDVDGNGLPDYLAFDDTSTSEHETSLLFLNKGLKGSRLSTISLSSGATIDVSYEQVPILDRNPYGQTQTFYAVSEITKDDGLGNTSTSTYEYADGKYYFHEEHYRSFTGFGSVSVTDDEGNTRIVYNHQGNDSDTDNGEFEDVFSKVGLPYRIEEYDASGNLYRVTIQKWDEAELETGRAFAKLIRKTVLNYDGDLDHKDTATEYVYDDTTGNQTGEVHYGEVTATDDGSYTDVINTDEKFTTIYVYATDASGIVLNKLSAVRLEDAAGTVIAEERYLYDSLPGGEVSLGNKTGKTTWQNMPTSWYVESYTVDAYGLTTSFTDARGKTTTIDYDSNNLYPETTTNARGQVTTTEYELRNGQVKSTTNPNGFTSETEFDGFGRPISISVPDPITGTTTELTSFDYDDTSFPSSVTSTTTVSGVSIESRQYFDGFKRLIQEWKPSEDSTATWVDYFYDSRGNVASTTFPYTGTATTWTGLSSSAASVDTLYDVLGRPTSVSTPSGTSTYVYDEWSVVATDAEGHTKSQTFNANGNLIQVDEHNGSAIYTTNYNYDELGNLTLLTDAQGNVRSFVYDSLGRQRIQEDLHSPTATGFRAWRSQYDANGNRTRITDPMGQVINYFYDDLNRLIKEDWNNDGTFDVVYNHDGGTNGIGYVSRIISDGLVVNFVHDKAGNTNLEVKQMGATSYVTQTVYDLMGRQASVTYPGAFYTVSTTYNAAGQVETVTKESSLVVSDMDYDVSGQISSITYANGTVTTNTYDPLEDNRLTHKVTTGSYNDGTTVTTGNIQDLTYTYDDIGNITSILDASITSTAKTSTYTYDDLSRLLSVTTSGLASGDYTESYTYDSVGNMTYKSDVGTFTYAGTGGTGSPNPHAVTSVAGVAYTYDANGNLISDGTHTYTWNIKNQMTATGSWTYSYDSQGTRFKSVKSSPAETTLYVNPYLELRNAVPTTYLYAGPLRVASFESSQLSTYHQDHLGGTALVTDSTGTTIQLYDYAPFGKEKLNTTTGTLDAAYSFTGKEYEEDTGLYYFEARWYNPTIARFVSEDPAQWGLSGRMLSDPQRLNFYSYSGNNPIKNVDPNGQESESVWYNPLSWDWEGIGNTILQTLDTVPGTGDISDVYACVTGETLFTQQTLTEEELGITAIMGILPIATGGQVRMAEEVADVASKYNWGDPSSLVKHLNDHGADFGITSIDNYADSAQGFFSKGMDDTSGYFRKIDDKGTIRIYDSETNTFGAFSADGATRTYYKPDPSKHHAGTNMDYWDAQSGSEF